MKESTSPRPECNHHNCPLKLNRDIKKKKINYPDVRADVEDRVCPFCGKICRGLGFHNHIRMKHKLDYKKMDKKNLSMPNTNSSSSLSKVLPTENKPMLGKSEATEPSIFDGATVDALTRMIRKELKDDSSLKLHFSSLMYIQEHPPYRLGEEYVTIKIDSKSAAIIDQKFPRALKEIFGFQTFLWRSNIGTYTDNNIVRINKFRIPLLNIAILLAMFNNVNPDSLA